VRDAPAHSHGTYHLEVRCDHHKNSFLGSRFGGAGFSDIIKFSAVLFLALSAVVIYALAVRAKRRSDRVRNHDSTSSPVKDQYGAIASISCPDSLFFKADTSGEDAPSLME
jgi:hypothetical protein